MLARCSLPHGQRDGRMPKGLTDGTAGVPLGCPLPFSPRWRPGPTYLIANCLSPCKVEMEGTIRLLTGTIAPKILSLSS